MNKHLLVVSDVHDPFINHAIEELLFFKYAKYQHILFLWINEPTVVFGRNQNPWREINLSAALANNVRLIRRLSGGGTVYHDLGNLNFSFMTSSNHYNELHNFDLIQQAILNLGIRLDLSPRKDLTLNDEKVSGNAFYLKGNRRLHHGTLLVDTDDQRLWQMLKRVDTQIKSKSIKSVPSPVTTLKKAKPDIRMDQVINSIVDLYYKTNQYDIEVMSIDEISAVHPDDLSDKVKRLASWEWTFGETPTFQYHVSETAYLHINGGYLKEIIGDMPDVPRLEHMRVSDEI